MLVERIARHNVACLRHIGSLVMRRFLAVVRRGRPKPVDTM
jgi:hypothetical protein